MRDMRVGIPPTCPTSRHLPLNAWKGGASRPGDRVRTGAESCRQPVALVGQVVRHVAARLVGLSPLVSLPALRVTPIGDIGALTTEVSSSVTSS